MLNLNPSLYHLLFEAEVVFMGSIYDHVVGVMDAILFAERVFFDLFICSHLKCIVI